MITDIYMAAITGGRRQLPFFAPDDQDINEFRKALLIDPASPATFNPLIRVIGAFPYTMDGLPIPVPPPGIAENPSITGSGPLAVAWTTGSPPYFTHVPSTLPMPLVWTLTRLSSTTAKLVNDAGLDTVVECKCTNDTLFPVWPSYVGSNMGAVVSHTYWEAGSPVQFSIPPTSYPFAFADAALTSKPFTMRLLSDAGAITLHASLLRPQERVAVVAAAVVKRFVRNLIQVSNGYAGPSIPGVVDPQDPAQGSSAIYAQLLAWYNSVLALGNNLLAADV